MAIAICDVVKNYDHFCAIKNISLEIKDSEFFTLLGPSGCGKTTLLKMIAGFEQISTGEILLYGKQIANLPPNRRPVNTVFQNYALFPHLTVRQNIKFGLQMLGKNDSECNRRAAEMLELVQLNSFAERYPLQLSGGQQQRVALARALAPAPQVLLLDEPLSALDLKLRQSMRTELKQIQQDTGITFIFVTHDQEEALVMSDRIVVMSEGQVQQVGSASEIYEAPSNKFVANFIGETNFLSVDVKSAIGDYAQCRIADGTSLQCSFNKVHTGDTGVISIRPERISFCSAQQGDLRGQVSQRIYLGTDVQIVVKLPGDELIKVRMQNSNLVAIPNIGDVLGLKLEAGAAHLLEH
ncbi:MAG: ABC transporter ATP-binding protein [Pseudomonadales bacterium]|nr:ABC transporter ATP-binding protein [Pseudomonadales bacterium]